MTDMEQPPKQIADLFVQDPSVPEAAVFALTWQPLDHQRGAEQPWKYAWRLSL